MAYGPKRRTARAVNQTTDTSQQMLDVPSESGGRSVDRRFFLTDMPV